MELPPHTPDRDPPCPACGVAMARLRYLDEGPRVWRCNTCMALFATQEQLEKLAAFRPKHEPDDPPTLLDRLRSLFS